jgi:hypothetical protein
MDPPILNGPTICIDLALPAAHAYIFKPPERDRDERGCCFASESKDVATDTAKCKSIEQLDCRDAERQPPDLR